MFTGACSEIKKRRFKNACCADKSNWLGSNPQVDPFKAGACPANRPVKPILASARNLLSTDASGAHHTFHLILTTQLSKNATLDYFKQSASVIAEKESNLKVTADKIRDLSPSKLEVGIMFPNSSDYQALHLNESYKTAQLATHSYLRHSSIFQHKLSDIASLRHRFARALPNASQVHVIARFAYLKIKSAAWRLNLEAPFLSKAKIYDATFPWRHQVIMLRLVTTKIKLFLKLRFWKFWKWRSRYAANLLSPSPSSDRSRWDERFENDLANYAKSYRRGSTKF